MNNVFIGLGSNLDNPLSQIKTAINNLQNDQNITVCNISAFYRSAPMGPQDQPEYINAVIEIATTLSPEKLLDLLQKIENEQGRIRETRWGARTLDLDILLYGKNKINSERLTVPHKGISQRNFVLYPLRDLVELDFEIPILGKLDELLKNCPLTGITRLNNE